MHQQLSLLKGRQLGKYRLVRKLGQGGYCEVWKARDTIEGIDVALKIPQPDEAGKRDNETILREVRLVAQLRHPNIMPLKNADIIRDHAILATEISAKTLFDCPKPMAPRRLITIATQVLNGLACAHRKKIIHCDVTPGNIFLLDNGTAALGDFGISVLVKRKMVTTDDIGTPGYFAPEQAYGKPSYSSDCFSLALVIYEYLTGHLPAWPFHWPPKHFDRLKKRTSVRFTQFVKKSLAIEPANRFANATEMLNAMNQALPKSLAADTAPSLPQKHDWKQHRRAAFKKRYKNIFPALHRCVNCTEPVAEPMLVCPWCGTDKNRFENLTPLPYYCPRCHKGLAPSWKYCPYCYGPSFDLDPTEKSPPVHYHDKCTHCGRKTARFMKYCPACRRKIRKPWHAWPFPHTCPSCKSSVDKNFWTHCPWCKSHIK
ncbi:Serine/threonine-protein kinase StkP [Anaerohalosphaera lusitana]|uniref:Serine/threonine-protein kinase StkP n=1 Tax=Anaerohalosphaera lusitana TaxID=1936003 RepID=A0A1U9NK03_9BACT|nr:serine/threonine-protein kinase [Anaerohalosphaera lusitana]AQT68145.1 Serine/threonine-protein kinase StkP [Anaerohalosphaera lusitana]